MNKIPVGVLGASGYAGRELCGLILGHPQLELAFATANEQRGGTVRFGGRSVTFVGMEEAALDQVRLVFSALPHGASSEWSRRAAAAGARVVDLSADLRPGNTDAPAVYGLTELNRAAIAGADLVANPGCYPTSILLPLAPFLRDGLVNLDQPIVVNAASGVSGAGNSPKRELLFAEVGEDFRAYGIGNTHRHLNEMRATVDEWTTGAELIFTPHLLPVARGILSTITIALAAPIADPLAPLRAAYDGEPFIEIADTTPTLRDVVRRNVVRISAVPLAGTRRPMLLITSAIDNLVKGAAGQALQNANLMLGLAETAGLPE